MIDTPSFLLGLAYGAFAVGIPTLLYHGIRLTIRSRKLAGGDERKA